MRRRVRALRRPLRRTAVPPRRRRKRRLAAVLLLAALALVWKLSGSHAPPPPAAPLPAPVAAKKPVKAKPRPAAVRTAPPPSSEPDRDILAEALRRRAAALSGCAGSGGARPDVPGRRHIAQTGTVQAVEFVGDPGPSQAACMRKQMLGWDLSELKLAKDVTILTSFVVSQQL